MKDKPLANVRIAILATNDFEQSEMTEPRQALMEAGAQTTLIAPESGKLQAMKHDMKADYFDVDLVRRRSNPLSYRASSPEVFLIPGRSKSFGHRPPSVLDVARSFRIAQNRLWPRWQCVRSQGVCLS